MLSSKTQLNPTIKTISYQRIKGRLLYKSNIIETFYLRLYWHVGLYTELAFKASFTPCGIWKSNKYNIMIWWQTNYFNTRWRAHISYYIYIYIYTPSYYQYWRPFMAASRSTNWIIHCNHPVMGRNESRLILFTVRPKPRSRLVPFERQSHMCLHWCKIFIFT